MKYNLKINLECSEQEIKYYEGCSEYVGGKFDNVKITNKIIEINFSRSGRKNLETIISNDKNSISQQINRCLCYLYGISGKSFTISDIQVNELDINYNSITFKDIIQPFEHDLPQDLIFSRTSLETLFRFEPKTQYLIIALVLFFKAHNQKIEGDKFSELWKSFNSIYSSISSKNTENEKLADIRMFLSVNHNCFSKSLNIVDIHNKNDIRKLLIRDMILNNYDTDKKTKIFHDFILRFEDCRLNEMFSEILVYRKDYLQQFGLLISVEQHITSSISANKKNNQDLLCFYILKYSYFLRNKYFHAEKIDSSFHLVKTREVENIGFINGIFQQFLHDLISCNNIFNF